MIRNATLPVALVVAAAVAGAPVAYAATGAGSAMPATSSTSMTHSVPAPTKMAPLVESPMTTQEKMKIHYISFSDRVSMKDVEAFASSKITLLSAIIAAEGRLNGEAVEAVFRAAPERPHFVVWVMRDKRVYATWVDADSGRVIWHARGIALSRFYPSERAEFLATMKTRSNLAGAVSDVLNITYKGSSDRPIAASFESGDYYVVAVNHSKVLPVDASADNAPLIASK